ncbi:hypothetical protein A176_000407 [Myxococcus hansupus]|uniref:Secreted protein n=1 Tax=Pseudomyxococcus hansupus TaxID=1297742 RepID=A0A0H4WQC0_9BACT|nr:hypothetical protein [Myxococcus hansupus]AKQ63495.1 hypothetical protein A176_000407 [Myxococcus hansupus]
MRDRPHPFLRWLRLVLTCLTLASSGASALPVAEAAVVCRVEAQAPRPPRAVLDVTVAWSSVAGAFDAAPLSSSAPEVCAAADAPAPARRLYLLHRVLLH